MRHKVLLLLSVTVMVTCTIYNVVTQRMRYTQEINASLETGHHTSIAKDLDALTTLDQQPECLTTNLKKGRALCRIVESEHQLAELRGESWVITPTLKRLDVLMLILLDDANTREQQQQIQPLVNRWRAFNTL